MSRVLVVDNDDAIRETARFLLEDAGYDVLEAPDGVIALDVLTRSECPLVVLLDLVMPRLGGIDVLRAARRSGRLRRHAFVAWTASRIEIPADLLSALDVPLVTKPFDLDELLAVVSSATRRLTADGQEQVSR